MEEYSSSDLEDVSGPEGEDEVPSELRILSDQMKHFLEVMSKRSQDETDAEAQFVMGMMHQQGAFGDKLSEKKAEMYYQRAASMNYFSSADYLKEIREKKHSIVTTR